MSPRSCCESFGHGDAQSGQRPRGRAWYTKDLPVSFRVPRARPSMQPLRRLDADRVVECLPRLYRAALAWTGSREDAEDLVQETCARVLARRRLLRGEDELGYLLRAMHNTMVSQRRTAGRRPVTTPLIDDLPVGAPASDDPAAVVEADETFAAVLELPEEFRDAVVAVDVAGLSYVEAAHVLRVPEGTLTSRLFRGRDRLARRLGNR
jgi:RNA polymerase sigma-70 factor, ECF subfamily